MVVNFLSYANMLLCYVFSEVAIFCVIKSNLKVKIPYDPAIRLMPN